MLNFLKKLFVARRKKEVRLVDIWPCFHTNTRPITWLDGREFEICKVCGEILKDGKVTLP